MFNGTLIIGPLLGQEKGGQISEVVTLSRWFKHSLTKTGRLKSGLFIKVVRLSRWSHFKIFFLVWQHFTYWFYRCSLSAIERAVIIYDRGWGVANLKNACTHNLPPMGSSALKFCHHLTHRRQYISLSTHGELTMRNVRTNEIRGLDHLTWASANEWSGAELPGELTVRNGEITLRDWWGNGLNGG